MRWGRLAPPAVAVAALLAAAGSVAGPVGAADPPWVPPACPVSAETPTTSGAAAGGVVARVAVRIARAAAAPGVPWFRIDSVLDSGGTLVGRRLSTGDVAAGTRRRLDLPAEAFASGPFGDTILVGGDDGRRSKLRIVDPVAGCAVEAGTSGQVIRSGVLTATGDAVVEHRVARTTRADLGVWRRPLDGSPATRVLGPLPRDAAYGPIFATELAWGTDGRLAVVSCGQVRCRARVVDPATGDATVVSDVGPLVGLSGDTLVVHGACAGLPCPVEAVSLATGRRRVLVEQAGLAVLAGEGRRQLVWEVTDGVRGSIFGTDLPTGRTTRLGTLPRGSLLHPSSARAGSGLATRDGWVVITPGGRIPPDVGRGHGHAINPLTGTAATFQELDR